MAPADVTQEYMDVDEERDASETDSLKIFLSSISVDRDQIGIGKRNNTAYPPFLPIIRVILIEIKMF